MSVARIGFSGHQSLSPATQTLVRKCLADEIASRDEVVGLSSLAAGADQIFSEVILETGNRLEVVVPSAQYESSFEDANALAAYRRLLKQAIRVVDLAFVEPSEEAFFAAGRDVVDRSAVLIAVWDGKPAAGLGGTADVVNYARGLGREVVIVWPDGSARA